MKRALALYLLCGTTLALAGPPDWIPAGGYGQTMTVIVAVTVDGVPATDPGGLVGAFVGAEVRGLGQNPVDLGGTYVFFVSIAGDAAADVTLQYYDPVADAVRVLCEGFRFQADAVRGSLSAPYVLHTADGASACALTWAVPEGYAATMSATVALYFDGLRSADPADRVAAFVGPEIRGVGVPFAAGSDQAFALDIHGDLDGEVLTFRRYDASTGATLPAGESLLFAAGTTVGTPSAPFAVGLAEALPVELTTFSALGDGDGVWLRWATASETNNAGFVVEHRPAAEATWRRVAFVEGAGTTVEGRAYTYRVDGQGPGTHRFRLRQIDFDGTFALSPEVAVRVALPQGHVLTAAYPNPFAETSRFSVSVRSAQAVRVSLFDLLGREVRRLYDGPMAADRVYPFVLNAAGLPSGVYVYRASGEGFGASGVVTRVR